MYIIDRIEEGIAVCESITGEIEIEIAKKDLPKGAKEGDIVCQTESGYILDKEASERRRLEMKARLHKLFEKSRKKKVERKN